MARDLSCKKRSNTSDGGKYLETIFLFCEGRADIREFKKDVMRKLLVRFVWLKLAAISYKSYKYLKTYPGKPFLSDRIVIYE